MLALFDDNFKTAIIKKYFNGQLGTCLKQIKKKKKKSGQRKKEIKRNKLKNLDLRIQ